MSILKKIFGDLDDKEIKKMMKTVEKIEGLEPEVQALSDEALKNKTLEFKERLKQGETEDDIMEEAFAVVREAAWRSLGMKHFPVQLLGGMVLHQGRISEMKTGEGKTLVATLPGYLNALRGEGVHVVTVNDYLARRDSETMGKVYNFLGLSVGLVVHGLNFDEKQAAYNSDITYGTNNEYGFDYLRDNMVIRMEQRVQRKLNYAIIDEVDSILIDEARTPLIISGSGDKSTKLYSLVNNFVKKLKHEVDFTIDEKANTVVLTDESGLVKTEKAFGIENLADMENMELAHHINQALRANFLMKRDKDYVVNDGQVIIVDEFTGRLMPGRRYSNGLHQAIEAKENVKVERESKTLATITFQNYFRMYNKLSGMTGTAKTEEEEFKSIYNMDVLAIPTNKPMIRDDMVDLVYKSEMGKFSAIVEEIKSRNQTGQPVLVGTISIEKSEVLSTMLKKQGIPHQVLNAKYHEKEAEIISMAGQKNAVTISTNMAGRGTDIVLGEGVKELGGLHILGTERHESRRIDNQLRGRSGRQGDEGSSQFFISLEDELMRLFGSERIMGLVDNLGLPEDMPIENKMLSKGIENAQKKVEGRNFDIRKHVLQYDNVMNKQREIIYSQRKTVLEGGDIHDQVLKMYEGLVEESITIYTGFSEYFEEWDLNGLFEHGRTLFSDGFHMEVPTEQLTRDELKDLVYQKGMSVLNAKEEEIGKERFRELERVVLLRVVDRKWMDHIDDMEQLKQGIGLRAYGQVDPVAAYTNEGFDMFEEMTKNIQEDTIKYLFHLEVQKQPVVEEKNNVLDNVTTNKEDAPKREPVIKKDKPGRNDPCPCGSGKKYKKCCGRNE
ncbi:preprotein translocase subunit SecA [Alkalibacter saccharofermentans]|uniref:Protein translocase subunit SecA n=1 Tax=Alkalibacter saccharofermentans DSM 14828 TaxID=1120975 RepID=A0A1M4VDK5_9FIRM|nr:preprotein translocase subunit SecA [Alkalibacter saccharofermentans]SHE67015.1 protein translocase subunit secA [Alkalibacter saccharofermentans DSM 14828]